MFEIYTSITSMFFALNDADAGLTVAVLSTRPKLVPFFIQLLFKFVKLLCE